MYRPTILCLQSNMAVEKPVVVIT